MKHLPARFDTVHFGFHDAALDDAYRFCSIAANMRVAQLVNGNRGIHVLLARKLLEQLPCSLDLFDRMPAAGSQAGSSIQPVQCS